MGVRRAKAHTHSSHSDMDLSFLIPVIGKVAISTHLRHSDMNLSFPIPIIGKVALSTQSVKFVF